MIGAAGQNASVTFHATQGQRMQMQVTGSTFGRWNMYWRLYRPDGTRVLDRNDNDLVDTMQVDQTGVWRVEFDPQYDLTGSLTWRAWSV